MSEWSLPALFDGLNDDIQTSLQTIRKTIVHPGAKGDGSEQTWIELFNNYLPARYQAAKAHVVDSKGQFSQEIDVLIFDRQYSPFIFDYKGQKIVPAESVYAVFESKQGANAKYVDYAQKKVASVRKLHRTSLPIPHAGGTFPAKPLIPIYGGLLSLESDWNPPMGDPFINALHQDQDDGRLEFACIAAHGYAHYNEEEKEYDIRQGAKPATAFVLKLISQLQFSGTVPMIDVDAYAHWLYK